MGEDGSGKSQRCRYKDGSSVYLEVTLCANQDPDNFGLVQCPSQFYPLPKSLITAGGAIT